MGSDEVTPPVPDHAPRPGWTCSSRRSPASLARWLSPVGAELPSTAAIAGRDRRAPSTDVICARPTSSRVTEALRARDLGRGTFGSFFETLDVVRQTPEQRHLRADAGEREQGDAVLALALASGLVGERVLLGHVALLEAVAKLHGLRVAEEIMRQRVSTLTFAAPKRGRGCQAREGSATNAMHSMDAKIGPGRHGTTILHPLVAGFCPRLSGASRDREAQQGAWLRARVRGYDDARSGLHRSARIVPRFARRRPPLLASCLRGRFACIGIVVPSSPSSCSPRSPLHSPFRRAALRAQRGLRSIQ